MTFKLRILLLVCLVSNTVMGQNILKSRNVVTKVPPRDGKAVRLNGVSYALPRTVVHVSLPFKRKDATPGEFGSYAPCFFPKDVAAGRVTTKATTFSLETPAFSSSGEPDPSERYIAKIKGGFFEDKTMFLEFNPDGVITKGEMSSTNNAIDVVIGAVRTAISIASAGFTPAAAPTDTIDKAIEKAAEESQVDICRALVVADAASMVVDVAEAAAKAADDDAAKKKAEEARAQVRRAELEIAAANKELLNQLELRLDTLWAARQKLSAMEAAAAAPDDAGASRQPATRKGRRRGNGGGSSTLSARLRASEEVGRASTEVLRSLSEIQRDLSGISSPLLQTVVGHARAAEQAARQAADLARTKAPEVAEQVYKVLPRIGDTIAYVGYGTDAKAAQAFANGYDRAKEVNDRLLVLRAQRENLLTGQGVPANLPADTLKLLIDKADETITGFEQKYFLGSENSDAWTANFRFTPGKFIVSASFNEFQTSPVLLVQTADGLCATEESKLQGVRIKGSFQADFCSPAKDGTLPKGWKALWLSVARKPDDKVYMGHMAAANASEERRGDRGFYYRIPATAVVRLESGTLKPEEIVELATQSKKGQDWRTEKENEPPPEGKALKPAGSELARNLMKVAQLGVTISLPASAAGRTTQYTIDFDEATGAMKNFKLGSNALLQKTIVEEAGAAADDIIAARQARQKAREEAGDQLNLLKRELEILQTQNLINEEKKKLAGAQPTPTP